MRRQLTHQEIQTTLPPRPLALVLDKLRTPANIGMLLRTAAALHLTEVFTLEDEHFPKNIEKERAARQALDCIALKRYPHTRLQNLMETLAQDNYCLVGIEYTNDSQPLPNFTPLPQQPYALVVGNERNGIGQELLQSCALCLHIPISPKLTSLNVANAGAMALYHFAFRHP
jgi:23S rRNA (guanosine2251-2'-O)-methyltransferase